jgi:hypothetical protein
LPLANQRNWFPLSCLEGRRLAATSSSNADRAPWPGTPMRAGATRWYAWSVLLFLALSCLAAAAVGSVVVYQRGASSRLAGADGTARLPARTEASVGEEPRRPEPTLETLQHGDIVLDGNDDYVVVGTLTYREEQDSWTLHVLDAGARRRFLEVRRRRGVLEVALLDAVGDAPVHGQLVGGLTYRGKPLTLDSRGDARVQPGGDTDDRGHPALLRYARYSGPGGALLLVEEEGVTRRAYHGHEAPPSSLQIYPHA